MARRHHHAAAPWARVQQMRWPLLMESIAGELSLLVGKKRIYTWHGVERLSVFFLVRESCFV